jgi:hypothetical protein
MGKEITVPLINDKCDEAPEKGGFFKDLADAMKLRISFGSPSKAETFCYVFVFTLPSATTDAEEKEFEKKFLGLDKQGCKKHAYMDVLTNCLLQEGMAGHNTELPITCDSLRSLRAVAISVFKALVQSVIDTYEDVEKMPKEEKPSMIYEFTSEDTDELFVCIKFSAMVVEQLAEVRGYYFQLDRKCFDDPRIHIKLSDPNVIPAFVKYEHRIKNNGWFKTKKGETTPLKNMDRVRLTYDKLQDYFNLSEFRRMDLIVNDFPPHNRKVIQKLLPEWATPKKVFSPMQPIDDVRNYFGESIAFYFLFTQQLGVWQLWFLIFCVPAGLCVKIFPDASVPNVYARLIYAIAVCVWFQLFRRHWLLTEQRMANKWGMDTAMATESSAFRTPINPNYKGTLRPSAVNENQLVVRADPRKKRLGHTISIVVQIMYMGVIVAAVSANQYYAGVLDAKNPGGWTTTLAALALSVQIQVFGKMWDSIATKLTDLECIWDLQQYDQAKARKLFNMKFINTFFSFVYTSFFQAYIDPRGCGYDAEAGGSPQGACFAKLQKNLFVVYFSYVAFGLVGMMLPVVQFKLNLFWERREMRKSGMELFQVSLLEQQGKMLKYQGMDQAADYLELIFPLGFIVMFSMAFPFGLNVFATIAVLTQIRADAWKLLVAFSRPYPWKCDGIGVWNGILARFEYFSVLVNSLLVVTQLDRSKLLFFSDYMLKLNADSPQFMQALLFLLCLNIMVMIRFLVQNSLPDTDSEFALRLRRQKLQRKRATEIGEPHAKEVLATSISASNADDLDSVPKCKPGDKQYTAPFVM